MSEDASRSGEERSPTGPQASCEAPLFDVVLTPHRSLGPRGFFFLMLAVAGVSFSAGLFFFLVGAWPVVGFLGLDVLLIYGAFKLNYRAARMYETLTLTPEHLEVQRVNHWGEQQCWRFSPAWLRVEIDDEPESDSPLLLRAHGKRLEIARFLSPEERLDLAQALRRALAPLSAKPCAPL